MRIGCAARPLSERMACSAVVGIGLRFKAIDARLTMKPIDASTAPTTTSKSIIRIGDLNRFGRTFEMPLR